MKVADILYRWVWAYVTKTGLVLRGGGDSPPAQQVSNTTTTTNIPEYARPYFERAMDQSEAIANQGYIPYGGQRVQGFTPMQQQAFNQVGNMQEPGQIGDATRLTGTAAQGALGTTGFQAGHIGMNYIPGQIGSTYQQQNIGPTYNPGQVASMYNPTAVQSGYNPNAVQMFNAPSQVHSNFAPGQFDSKAAQQYMDPYQQNVTDIAKREANHQFAQQQVAADANAAHAGAFGGSRQGLVASENLRNQNQLLNDIQTQGNNAAFQNAQQQYERDRSAQQQAAAMGLGAQQFNAQQQMAFGQAGLGAQQYNEQQRQQAAAMGLTAQQFNQQQQQQAAQMGLGAQQFNEQSRQLLGQQGLSSQQFNEQQRQQMAALGLQGQTANEAAWQQAAQIGLQGQTANEAARANAAGIQQKGYALAGDMGAQLGNLGQSQQQMALARANAMNQMGTQQQQLGQLSLDTAYQDFVNQRDYNKQNAAWLMGQLRGVPVSSNSNVMTTAPGPNPISQMAGLGIAGAGLYRAMQ